MIQLKIDYYGKPGSIASRPFRLIVGLLSSAYPGSRLVRFEPRTYKFHARMPNL